MLMSHCHLRGALPGCGILSLLSLWSSSCGASSVAGEGHQEVHVWLGGDTATLVGDTGAGRVLLACASCSCCTNGIFSGVVAPL